MAGVKKGKKKKLLWEPTKMAKPKDNLISSDYANADRFQPECEKGETNMFHLLAMEYGRMWKHERETNWGVVLLATQDDGFLQRRYVIRGLLKKKQKQDTKEPFKMKKFQNVQSKIKPLLQAAKCGNAKQEDSAQGDVLEKMKENNEKKSKGKDTQPTKISPKELNK